MNLLRPTLAAASAGAVMLALAACGGPGSNAADAPASQGARQQGQQGGAPEGRFPGASGLVADISGRTLQVQGQDGQTAVAYSGSTTFTNQVAATLAEVTVGSCVMVTPASTSGSSGSSGSAGPSGSTGSAPTTIAAGTVRITPATDGSCTRGDGRFGGTRPQGVPSGAPSGMPTERPSGAPSGRARFGFGALGTVSAVSTGGFVVAQQQFDGTSGSATTRDVAVTVSGATTYTTTKAAKATALKVGVCVTATGRADDTGAVTAQRIEISQPVDGQCGFGGFARFGGPGGTGGRAGSAGSGGAQS